jgi:hypothetical protein
MGISIILTILLGGFILFFIENQRHEEELEANFVAVMQPFYHRLTLLLHFIYFCITAIDSRDEDKKIRMDLSKFCHSHISPYESQSILSGGDIPFLKAKDVMTYVKALTISGLCLIDQAI